MFTGKKFFIKVPLNNQSNVESIPGITGRKFTIKVQDNVDSLSDITGRKFTIRIPDNNIKSIPGIDSTLL